MAEDSLSGDSFATTEENDDLETFGLVWLDANTDEHETRNADKKLRSIINSLRKFHDTKQCQKYIEQKSETDRLVLIVSGRTGREIVPSIHKLRQVMSIYVFCMDKKLNEQWTCKFWKVKAVVVEMTDLICRIKADHKIQKKVEEPLMINVLTAGESTSEIKGQFVFFQVLIDCLLRLKPSQEDKNELITWCENEYKDNYKELTYVRDFQETYSSSKALWWYTRDSFLYKTVNTALRKQNIHMIFLFREFIVDIQRELQYYQAKKPLEVYRSQVISKEELNKLEQCLGKYISVNSFFSTSIDYSTAASFLDSSHFSEGLERVVFCISADPRTIVTKPFADISKCSEFTDESEVLFMLGSIFRLDSIDCNDERIWIIRMTLCDDSEHDLKKVLAHMKQQIGSGETNLRTLGKLLWKMGKTELAEKYFERLLRKLTSDDPLLVSLYEDLAELASFKGDYDGSVYWQNKSIEIKEHNPSIVKSNAIATACTTDKSRTHEECQSQIEPLGKGHQALTDRVTSLAVGRGTIEVEKGDITEQTTDVIIGCLSSKHLRKSILNAAGKQIKTVHSKEDKDNPNSPIIITPPGHLHCKSIFFLRWEPDSDDDVLRLSIIDLISNVIQSTRSHGYTSIAFPSIGCGDYKCSINVVVKTMVREMKRTIEERKLPWMVRFVIHPSQPDVYDEFRKQLLPTGHSSNSFELPSTWQHGDDDQLKFIVPKGTDEYNAIIGKFDEEMKGRYGEMLKLERVQNERWYMQYMAHWRDFKKRLNEDTEKRLYHGCLEISTDPIIQDCFNRSFAGVNGTVYGVGVYFSKNATFCHSYAKPNANEERCMFVARVLVGKTTLGNSSMKTRPVGFDSTTDGNHMTVTYHDAQAYAEYLITYK